MAVAQAFPDLQFSQISAGGRMHEEADGKMYVVNNGKLCVWDGFKSTPVAIVETNESIGKSIDKFILKDNLIFISYTDGVSVYNRATKQYIFYSQNSGDPRYKIANNAGSGFFKDSKGNVYLQGGVLYKVNADLSLTKYEVLSSELKAKGLILENVAFEDRQGVLWLNCKDAKLVKLNADKTIDRYYNLLQLSQSSFWLFQDSFGRYWIHTWGKGLRLFDPATGDCKMVNKDLDGTVIKDMCEWRDGQNNLWLVLANERGITLVNPITFASKNFLRNHSNTLSHAKNSGEPFGVFVGSDNILWIVNEDATNEYIAPSRQKFTNYSLTTNYHYSRVPFAPRKNGDNFLIPNRLSSPDGNIWIGALYGKGNSVFTRQGEYITNYPNDTKTNSSADITFKDFNYITLAHNQNYIVTTNSNVVLWDKKKHSEIFKDELSVSEKGEYKSPNFTLIVPYKNDQWLIKSYEYLYLFNAKKKQLNRWFALKDSSNISISPKRIADVKFTKSGLWILYETALLQYDTATRKIVQLYSFEKKGLNYFPESQAMKFTEDADGNLWIVGSQGLLKFNTRKKTFENFKNDQQLKHEFVNILIDKKRNIWLLSGSDIICYNPVSGVIKTFSGSGALSGDEGTGIWLDSTDNHIWVGAGKYLTIFNPDSVLASKTTGRIEISQIMSGDSSISFDNKAKQYFTLPFDKNSVTIHASITNFDNVNDPLIAFRLSDKEEWKYSKNGDIIFYNLAPGNYNLQVAKAFYTKEILLNTKIVVPFAIAPPFYKSNWFFILFFIIMFLVGYAIYRFRIQAMKATAREKENTSKLLQIKTELEKKLSESEMATLQSQMNPHFIFNVLNSINRYILTSDAAKASEYLVAFSRLIRLILENSKSAKVSLQSDLDALQLYINMEKMRFEDTFQSIITIDKNVDTEFQKIPPLLIQPYVENAIWHGLLQKDGDKKLEIKISQPNERSILVTITDDGIGRKKAMELKSKSAVHNKSFGMQITKDRMGIVNKLFHEKNSVVVEDLYDNKGEGVGTRVILHILV